MLFAGARNPSFDLPTAWAQVAQLVGWIVALFGAPGELAQRLGLARRTRAQLLQWLAPAEALARRLLVIEAAASPAANTPAPLAPLGRLPTVFADRAPRALQEDSAQWPVVFHLGLPRRAPANPPNRRLPAPPRTPFNAAPLARRLEALARLCANRAGAVARLARRLRAQPETAARAFLPYPHAAAGPAAEPLARAQADIEAWRARRDSS
ncbi:MAG: hypothetical protein AB7M12_06775 [Hyphomonadaceae bacterium]